MQPIDILSAIEIEINNLIQDINIAKSRDLHLIDNLAKEKE
jgi:hypothetical protein